MSDPTPDSIMSRQLGAASVTPRVHTPPMLRRIPKKAPALESTLGKRLDTREVMAEMDDSRATTSVQQCPTSTPRIDTHVEQKDSAATRHHEHDALLAQLPSDFLSRGAEERQAREALRRSKPRVTLAQVVGWLDEVGLAESLSELPAYLEGDQATHAPTVDLA